MNTTFDTTTALAALFLWIMFNYLQRMLNCDVQRVLEESALARNVFGLIAFYFLFTVIDPNNNRHVGYIFLKTLVVYLLFVLAIKSRLFYIGTAIALLLVDQIIRNHIAYLDKSAREDKEAVMTYWTKIREYIIWAIIGVIIVGAIDYMFRKRKQYGKEFDLKTFLLGTNKCRGINQ